MKDNKKDEMYLAIENAENYGVETRKIYNFIDNLKLSIEENSELKRLIFNYIRLVTLDYIEKRERELILYYDKIKKELIFTEKVGEKEKALYSQNVEKDLFKFILNKEQEKETSKMIFKKMIPNYKYFTFIKIYNADNVNIIEENLHADLLKLFNSLIK